MRSLAGRLDLGAPGVALWALLGLAAVRVAIPLVALAASGHDLPLLPPYRYVPLTGDSEGFYAAARALISAATDVHPVLVLLELVALAGAALVAVRARRDSGRRWLAVLAAAAALALGATLVVLALPGTTGSAVVGWPLLLAVPLFPFRALGLGPGPDLTFAVGLTLSLLANAVTVAATAVLGARLTGRAAVGLGAAALWAVWPLLSAPLAGRSAWENGQWSVDTGLVLYTEPLSTVLVAVALALVAAAAPSRLAVCVAGTLLGIATAVKLSNGLLVLLVAAVLLVGRDGRRLAALAVAAAAIWMPLVAAYWPKGYVGMFGGQIAAEEKPFGLGNVTHGWGESLLYTPRLLAIAVPLVVVGLVIVPRRSAVLLGGTVALTAGLYSLYQPFAQHPRFLYVAFPAAFVLVAATLVAVGERIVRRARAARRARIPAGA
jgi:hypothetical protein